MISASLCLEASTVPFTIFLYVLHQRGSYTIGGLDWPGRSGLDLGDTSYYTGLGRSQPIGLLQQRPQAIGEAGYDLGITGRRRGTLIQDWSVRAVQLTSESSG
jgi:hypothetical protein